MDGFNMILVFIAIRVPILCKRARQKRSMWGGFVVCDNCSIKSALARIYWVM